MTVIDWFAGIGGFRLGLEPLGFQFIAHSEVDGYASKVYAKHWPGSVNLGDIREVKAEDIPDADMWVGGFPCEDISRCGRRKGLDGKKSGLWHEFARLIRTSRPRYVLLENSTSITVRGLGEVLADLADCGYDAEWDCLQAGTFGAPHPRARTFILAYSSGLRYRAPENSVFAGRPRPKHDPWWATEPGICRVDDGTSSRVDRLRCLGNAVVPAVVSWVGQRILEVYRVEGR